MTNRTTDTAPQSTDTFGERLSAAMSGVQCTEGDSPIVSRKPTPISHEKPPENIPTQKKPVSDFELICWARRLLKAAMNCPPTQDLQDAFEYCRFVTKEQEIMRRVVLDTWGRGEIVSVDFFEIALLDAEDTADPNARNRWIREIVEVKTAPPWGDFDLVKRQFAIAQRQESLSVLGDWALDLWDAVAENDSDLAARLRANQPEIPEGGVTLPAVLGKKIDLANCWERLAQTPIPFLADHLPLNCVSVLASPGGTGKGMLSLAMALSVARGESVLPSWKCRQGRVCLLSAEDSALVLSHRFAAIGRLHGLSAKQITAALREITCFSEGSGALVAELQGGGVCLTEDAAHLRDAIKRAKPDLVVIDPLIKYFGANENSNQGAAVLTAFFTEIAEACNCAVLLVHHTAKVARDSDSVTAGHIRGAGAFVDTARSAMTLSPSEGGTLLLRCVKCNYAPKGEPIMLTIEHGAIREVYQNTALVEADILAYLGDCPDSAVTINGIVKDSRGKGKDFRKAIIEKHPWVTAQTLQKIAENLVRINAIQTVEKRINNRTVQVLEVQ